MEAEATVSPVRSLLILPSDISNVIHQLIEFATVLQHKHHLWFYFVK